MKTIVVYYSRKGSNRYLANKIAESLSCDIESIKPRINVFMFFLMNIHLGIWPLKSNMEDYDRIILCGPIWMGKFIPPLKSFIKKYARHIKELVFVTCCGSTFEQKDQKFGHGLVFKKIQTLVKDRCLHCEAFPIDLVLPEEQKADEAAFMNTHLSDANFQGEIKLRFDQFIQRIKQLN